MLDIGSLILARKQAGEPLVIGINGIDASGKTSFAKSLAERLRSDGHHVQLIHLDDFHLSRERRRACTSEPPVCYYRQTFDWQRLLALLGPIRTKGRLEARLQVLDLETDTYSVDRHYLVTDESIVLLEGVFLFQPDLLPYMDLRIFLQISQEECLRRVVQRDIYLFGNADTIRERYLSKYLPGQALYLQECQAEMVADLLIDNEAPTAPVLLRPAR